MRTKKMKFNKRGYTTQFKIHDTLKPDSLCFIKWLNKKNAKSEKPIDTYFSEKT